MSADSAPGTSTATPTEPVHIDGQTDLDDAVSSYDVVLTDFHADWCGPCKMIEPIVESIAAETEAAVAKVDVDANQRLASSYGVRGVPTLVLFSDGDPVEKAVGAQSEEQLRSLVQGYLQ